MHSWCVGFWWLFGFRCKSLLAHVHVQEVCSSTRGLTGATTERLRSKPVMDVWQEDGLTRVFFESVQKWGGTFIVLFIAGLDTFLCLQGLRCCRCTVMQNRTTEKEVCHLKTIVLRYRHSLPRVVRVRCFLRF